MILTGHMYFLTVCGLINPRLINAGYFRMKNLQIGYTIPREILRPAGFDRVRVYFSANNLFTVSDFVPGMDPESEKSVSYPFARTYSFGLNVQF